MIYEIILTKKVTKDDFDNLIKVLLRYTRPLNLFKIFVKLENNKVLYFLKVPFKIPISMSNLEGFLFRERETSVPKQSISVPIILDSESDFLELRSELEIKKSESLLSVTISFMKLKKDRTIVKTTLMTESGKTYTMLSNPSNILTIDFDSNKNYTKSGAPKYLNIQKSMPLFVQGSENAVLQVDAFPYSSENLYLTVNKYDFSNHSIIFGSSGSGKSKFVSLLVSNALKTSSEEYKFVIIDPHAALEYDIGGASKVIDFRNDNSAVDLFKNEGDVISNTELLLELFKNELESYNLKLERVLRYSIYLLLYDKIFNFENLRKLITDLDFRNDTVKKSSKEVPYTIVNFFQTDFNELKTKSYGEAISPIVSFLDEMELLPTFNSRNDVPNLKSIINDNSVTLFSLDNRMLGSTGVRMISGLIMQNLFSLLQNRKLGKKIIFIIDEVAVIERNILTRYLSEARKYNLGLILMGQYFSQISDKLKSAIFANVQNYYIFKVSKSDASLLVDNLNIKLEGSSDKEKTVSFLTNLNMREVVIKVMKDGKDCPPFKGVTLDYVGNPRIVNDEDDSIEDEPTVKKNIEFMVNSVDLKELMKRNSTRRKVFYE